ncbi:ATPase, T2SS/T4P/T4SS family [Candidatus Riflebacteria bacterium]
MAKIKNGELKKRDILNKLIEDNLLNMEEAIKLLKTSKPTFYRWLRTGKIKGMKVGRQWRFQREDIFRFLKGMDPKIALTADPLPLLNELQKILQGMGQKQDSRTAKKSDPIKNIVALLIEIAHFSIASDIHIAPNYDRDSGWKMLIRTRIDGVLRILAEGDIRLLPAIIERWKTMSALNTGITHLPQDGRIKVKIANEDIDFRISCLPVIKGESLTARLLHKRDDIFSFKNLEFSSGDEAKLRRLIKSTHGIIFVNGPTGCGKTTTHYTCLSEIASPQIKSMTIEDPIEMVLPWLVQTQIRLKDGMTFAAGLRACLRQDPDVIMIGEVRDHESLELIFRTALTGHLVFTTLHTLDSAHALKRIVDIGIEPFVVGDASLALLSQRLVRKLCKKCSKKSKIDQKTGALIRQTIRNGGVSEKEIGVDFREPVGCPDCRNMGYLGRTLISEIMTMSPAISASLSRGVPVEELTRLAVAEGMSTMAADGVRKASHGITTLAEITRVRSLSSL